MSRTGTMATRRLTQDYLRLLEDPVPYVKAHPLPRNVFEWHYVFIGPENTPYQGGIYHGKLLFPEQYPFKAPSIYMMTPNGRFECNKRLCLSISDYHQESWNSMWSVSTILAGLLSFMLEDDFGSIGSMRTSVSERRLLAMRSLEFNLKNRIFCKLFPDIVKNGRKVLKKKK